MHGFPRMFKSEAYFLKIFWFTMTFVSLLAGIYISVDTILEYLKYDVFTKIQTVSDGAEVFPAVTLCINSGIDKVGIKNTIDLCFYQDLRCDLDRMETFNRNNYYNDCIRFNGFNGNESINLKQTSNVGDRNGLRIYFRDITYASVNINDNYLNSIENTVPALIKKGYFYDIDFRKSVNKRLSRPYNQCNSAKNNKNYRHLNCIDKCIHKQLAIRYNCSIPGYYMVQNLTKSCVSHLNDPNEKKKYFANKTLELEGECDCPEECDSITYSDTVRKDTYHDGYTALYVYFADMSYIEVSQFPKMSLNILISSIGGALGFSIGLSLLSLVELLEYFIYIICVLFI